MILPIVALLWSLSGGLATAPVDGIANCATGLDVARAVYSPTTTVALISTNVAVSQQDWNTAAAEAGTQLPLRLARPLNIQGVFEDSALWPTLDLQFVQGAVALDANGILTIMRVVLWRWRVAPQFMLPGLDMLATALAPGNSSGSASGSSVQMLELQDAAVIQRNCLPTTDTSAYNSVSSLPRPASVPGNQTWERVLALPSGAACAANSSLPALQRCWPTMGLYKDVAAYGQNEDAASRPTQAGYVLHLQGVYHMCETVQNETCTQQLGAVGCYYSMVPRYPKVLADTTTDAGNGTDGGGPSPPQPPLPSPPAPPAGEDGSSGGGSALGLILGLIFGLVGAAALAFVLVAGFFKWRRWKKQRDMDSLAAKYKRRRAAAAAAAAEDDEGGSNGNRDDDADSDPADHWAVDTAGSPAAQPAAAADSAAVALELPPHVRKQLQVRQDAVLEGAAGGAEHGAEAPTGQGAGAAGAGAGGAAAAAAGAAVVALAAASKRRSGGGGVAGGDNATHTTAETSSDAVGTTDGGKEELCSISGPSALGLGLGLSSPRTSEPASAVHGAGSVLAVGSVSNGNSSGDAAAARVANMGTCEVAPAAVGSATSRDSAGRDSAGAARREQQQQQRPPLTSEELTTDPLTVATPLAPHIDLHVRLGSGRGQVELLPVTLGVGAFGRVVMGMYLGQRVAVKVNDQGLLTQQHPQQQPQQEGGAEGERSSGAAPTATGGGDRPSADGLGLAAGGAGVAAGLAPEADAASAAAGQPQGQGLPWEAGRSQTPVPLNRGELKALVQEVQVLARCQHPGIVKLLAANLTPGQPLCLVVELMDTSLERLLYGGGRRAGGGGDGAAGGGGGHQAPGNTGSDGPWPLNRATRLLSLPVVLDIALQVARALAYLHPTVLHRDLKPANVLLSHADSEQPLVKLADFGLSRLKNSVVLTDYPEVGTVPYMAPEAFDVTHTTGLSDRADIYSFGVILWEMLTGLRPWADVNMLQIAVSVTMRQERPPLALLAPPRCPARLAALVAHCWEPDPRRRPAAAEVVKSLALVQQELTMATSSGALQRGGAADGACHGHNPLLQYQHQHQQHPGGDMPPLAPQGAQAPSRGVVAAAPPPPPPVRTLAPAKEYERAEMAARQPQRQPRDPSSSVELEGGNLF
ncbi:hypothetical protein HXX76_001128 [Chlamydomonas incerta]|uniref:Protein kinase domain-containing protein n=1 Tax=Chlamydomonas incerta TaxID=51695 RepID=A0A835WBQ0_CHLIN|nr:hypothetical protein HXX76_001128 [Chlamydomonas incerta]|eukprot:KAG2444372.1 hypothetical protein HXX76_001128 [Chlamydomonas incerta]